MCHLHDVLNYVMHCGKNKKKKKMLKVINNRQLFFLLAKVLFESNLLLHGCVDVEL